MDRIRFETHPDRYRHMSLAVDGAVATLTLAVREDEPLFEGYELKLNSYDLGVDIELADAVARLRFEHPEVRCLVLASGLDRIFCAGANIFMLGSSTHSFKVNFCKYTNETRLSLEDASAVSGIRSLAAINGIASGGGYELTMSCDEQILSDDGSSAVSFPETPLLGVLPGTGGLTRLVDKLKVRRDVADHFSTLAEGVKGRRAVKWGLVDRTVPASKFADAIAARAREIAAESEADFGHRSGPGVELTPLDAEYTETGAEYRHVSLVVDPGSRTANLTVRAPDADEPTDGSAMRERGADLWALRAFRELDDALLQLRFHHDDIGLVLVRTEGEAAKVLAVDEALAANRGDWFADEVVAYIRRTLKRLDLTAKSLFAIIDHGTAFAGTLFELALACDRSYMLDDMEADEPVTIALSAMNGGPYPMSNGLTRLQTRFLGEPGRVEEVLGTDGPIEPRAAEEMGLVTFAPDDIDWEEEVRIAVEERASLSPDALTGMEANLRFAGPETMETKIFGRLSAWQNWIFVRPNAVGETGALTCYGRPERPSFDWKRT
ncbi:MAG: 2,3-epoxybenzoyl-CoA dihydrolase [Planctomycetota bacterium]